MFTLKITIKKHNEFVEIENNEYSFYEIFDNKKTYFSKKHLSRENDFILTEFIESVPMCQEYLIIQKVTNSETYSTFKVIHFAECLNKENRKEVLNYFSEYLQTNKTEIIENDFIKIEIKTH